MRAGCMLIHRAPHRSVAFDRRQQCGPAACLSIVHCTAAQLLTVGGDAGRLHADPSRTAPQRSGRPSAAMRAGRMPIYRAPHRSAAFDRRRRCGPAACRTLA